MFVGFTAQCFFYQLSLAKKFFKIRGHCVSCLEMVSFIFPCCKGNCFPVASLNWMWSCRALGNAYLEGSGLLDVQVLRVTDTSRDLVLTSKCYQLQSVKNLQDVNGVSAK